MSGSGTCMIARGHDKDEWKRKVVEYLKQFDNAVRNRFEELVFPLPGYEKPTE